MKRGFAVILLLCHINFSMFLPQMAEVDIFDANGQQQDDINSLTEYIAVALGYDHTSDDEDDDSGQNFQSPKTLAYFNQQTSFVIQRNYTLIVPHNFSDYTVNKIPSVSLDIIVPPPKA